MKTPLSFFFILLLIGFMPLSFGNQVTVNAEILKAGEVRILEPEETIFDPGETLDLSADVKTVVETNESIGGIIVTLTQEVRIISIDNQPIVISNTGISDVLIELPNDITISAPATWNGEIEPPSIVSTSGEISSGFQTPTISISVGSPDVIIVFDKAVTLLLSGITGQTAYKLTGTNNWVLIDTCTGTFASPDDPPTNGECSITDDTDTKILTFHFTEFAEVEETVEETTQTTTGTTTSPSGGGRTGGGRTGVSTPHTGLDGEIKSSSALPIWLKQPILWWNSDQISAQEFSSIMGWLIDENIIKIENKTKPEKQIITMAPSTKHLFSLWEEGILSETIILNLVEKYREYGIW